MTGSRALLCAIGTDHGGKSVALARPLPSASLQTVKITVPVELNDPTDYARLGKLRALLLAVPISEPNIRYSVYLVRCPEHNTVVTDAGRKGEIFHFIVVREREREAWTKAGRTRMLIFGPVWRTPVVRRMYIANRPFLVPISTSWSWVLGMSVMVLNSLRLLILGPGC